MSRVPATSSNATISVSASTKCIKPHGKYRKLRKISKWLDIFFVAPAHLGSNSNTGGSKQKQAHTEKSPERPALPTSIEEWQKRQEQEDNEILETRQRPEYSMTYRQAVGTEDLYLQVVTVKAIICCTYELQCLFSILFSTTYLIPFIFMYPVLCACVRKPVFTVCRLDGHRWAIALMPRPVVRICCWRYCCRTRRYRRIKWICQLPKMKWIWRRQFIASNCRCRTRWTWIAAGPNMLLSCANSVWRCDCNVNSIMWTFRNAKR